MQYIKPNRNSLTLWLPDITGWAITMANCTSSTLQRVPGSKALLHTLITVLLVGSTLIQAQADVQPIARKGVLDLRHIDLAQQTVELTGEWRWYWNQLLVPNQPTSTVDYISFPHLWAGSTWKQKTLSNQGFATYTLTVLLPPKSVPLMLEVPDQYTSYRLWINGTEVAHDGNPATTPAATVPYWSTQLIRLPATDDTLQVLLQIANFDHAKGGSTKAIRLGEATRLAAELANDRALDLFLTGCVFMCGLFFLGLFGFSRTDRPMLYFSLFCLAYSYRIVGTDHYVLHTLFPQLPWAVSIRLEYGSLYLAIAAFVVYTQCLYPNDTYSRITKGMSWLCLAFAGTVVVLPSMVFTRLLNPFLGLMIVYIGYAFYVYWIAARRHRPGAQYSLMSTGVLLVVFCLILGQYFGIVTPSKAILFVGYLGFFFLQSLVLSFRFAFALNEARLTEKQFLANMSHEIRTPLNAILGFSNLLEPTPLTDEQREFLSYIRSAGKNLLAIVNDILDIAKIESGMLPLEVIPFSIHSLVDSIRTMLNSAASEKQLKLVADIDPALPAVLLGDPTRLTQILLNLMSNAIKFTKEGSVTVRVKKQEETAESVRVLFTIQDTGIGMAADVIPHIFERFRQANDSTTRHYGGTGLGLSIVSSLIKLQGGWIGVSSTPGEGSCFTLEIPYRIGQTPITQEISSKTVPGNTDDRTLTILVVEDNLMNQKLALGVLNRMGYNAQVAENGQQAIDRLQQDPTLFNVVLMDIQMPIMDGYAATRHIRNTLKSQVPIIAMTAHALASEREHCLQAGMNDFLSKPFQPADLQRLIQKYVARPSSRDEPSQPVPLPAVPAPIPVFSMDALLTGVDGDMAFALELLALFLDQTPTQIQEIRQAIADGDMPAVGRVIHGQKVAIQLFGLEQASQQIREIEALLAQKAAPTDVIPIVQQYLLALEAELPAIQVVTETMMNQPPAS